MPDIVPLPPDYADWLAELKSRIHAAQQRASLSVNRELVLLYWHIGRDILQRQSRDGWGSKVIDRLSQDLRNAFPDMKGFSPRNLKYMRAFADAWPDEAIVQEVLAQLPWYHQIALLDKLRTAEQRHWYAAKAIKHHWSRNVLVLQIESRLLERSGQAVTNFPVTLPHPQSDLAHESIKDPYRFDFLGLTDAFARTRDRACIGQTCDRVPAGTGCRIRICRAAGVAVQEQKQSGRRIRIGRQKPAHGHCRIQVVGLIARRTANQPAQHREHRTGAGR